MPDIDVKALVSRIASRKAQLDQLQEEDKADKAKLIEWARTQPLAPTPTGNAGIRVAGHGVDSVYVSFPAHSIVQQLLGKPALLARKIAGQFIDVFFVLRPCKDFRTVISAAVLDKRIAPADGRRLITLCSTEGTPRVIVNDPNRKTAAAAAA